MAEHAHSLSTCRIPLSALTYYYRRNLIGDAASCRGSRAPERRRTVRVAFDRTQEETVVTVAEFAAHVAYLEPWTGIGLLVAPRPGTDAWSGDGGAYGRTGGGLSLQTADRAHALKELDQAGWRVLDNGTGMVEPAGRTADGHLAVCMHAVQVADRQLVLEDLQHAITALHVTANLRHDW